jgi:small conductance mechanosensitive channel
VIGLTLIFSDAFNINDVVEASGQIGKVESIGLRFTILIIFNNQKIYLPNRNIGTISRYHKGTLLLNVDIQLPEILDAQAITDSIQSITKGIYSQHKSIILTPPELVGVMKAEGGNWRYLRINFRLLPGQGSLIENNFRQRVITSMKKFAPDYQEWMVSVTTKIYS